MAERRLLCIALLLAAGPALGQGKLLATGGAWQLEGQAGGGIVPWAVVAGYGEAGEWGGSAAATRVSVDDFDLTVAGASLGLGNRFELGYARQSLRVAPLDLTIDQDVLSAKWRFAGDLLYPGLPALAAGVQVKHNRDFAVPEALGAADDTGVDAWVAASRLWLNGVAGRNLFTNVTLRASEANQAGLLGFGGEGSDHELLLEASAGLFLDRHWVVGAEYRQKPDNLAAVREDDWADLFIGWFPTKRVAVVAAWADLGDIAGLRDQRGWYLSLQVNR
ncbi:DUF3034 family protein [Pseudohaliea sp.]|uniref:DUF3034 family protein n=1 Tax=Pseudohaliea sp. TaxID=2740289 RepID=UPI0032EB4693